MAKGSSSSTPSSGKGGKGSSTPPAPTPSTGKGGKASSTPTPTPSSGKGGKGSSTPTPVPSTSGKGGKNAATTAPSTTTTTGTPVQEKPRWTGKQPVQYLNEYCQKNQMDRPNFQEVKCKPNGKFKFKVILKFEGKKKQITEKEYSTIQVFDTVQEAKSYTALVALFSLCGNTTIYKLFPPEYTPYWMQLDQDSKLEEERNRQLQEQQLKFEAENAEPIRTHTQLIPQIHMSEEAMRIVHSLVLELCGTTTTQASSPSESSSFEDKKKLDEKEKEIITSTLTELGFKKDDVLLALVNVSNHNNIHDIIEWLCLNISNSQLPIHFRPKSVGLDKINIDQSPNITNTNTNIINESNKPIYNQTKIELENLAFLNRDIIKVINNTINQSSSTSNSSSSINDKDDEMNTFFKVYYNLFKLDVVDQAVSGGNVNFEECKEIIENERLALESIYVNNEIEFKSNNHIVYKGGDDSQSFKCNIYIPSFSYYPYQLPVITFYSSKSTPITNQIVVSSIINELKQPSSIGNPMLFNIISWIENNISNILLNKLKQLNPIVIESNSNSNNTVTTTTTTSNNTTTTTTTSIKSNKKQDKPYKQQGQGQKLNQKDKDKLNKELKNEYDRLIKQDKGIIKKRELLPVYKRKQEFLKCLEENQVVVITAETGCGKSTQIPQYILEDYIANERGSDVNIICTQPRRISAIGVAERVSYEWNCGISNNTIGGLIGYQIRNESKKSSSTKLLFCTTGILLRRILDINSISDVTHIIIDEVHERSIDNDFLLIILREIIKQQRKDLKIILMSATLNAKQISSYFNCGDKSIFSIPGFTYPVKNIYIDQVLPIISKYNPNYRSTDSTTTTTTTSTTNEPIDEEEELVKKLNQLKISYDQKRINLDVVESLILHLVCNVVNKEKSILVFVPGLSDILELCSRLAKPVNSFTESICNRIWSVPLHSSLSPKDQQKVFEKAPNGKIKIVIATNIAETSITIEDVEIVVDCGRVNQMTFNPITRNSIMSEEWTSKASCRQRAGRAGRTSSGLCYKVFTRQMESQLQDQDTPEILRTSLQQLCLHVKLFLSNGSNGNGSGSNNNNISIQEFLSRAIEPPSQDQIKSSIDELISIDALNIVNGEQQQLTPLGYHLASLPVDVYIGKMLIFGCIFRCLDPILTIAATLNYKSPFLNPADKSIRPQDKFSTSNQSDHQTMVNSYIAWKKSIADGNESQFCRENSLSIPTLRTIQDLKLQFVEILSEIGFLPQSITAKRISKLQQSDRGSLSDCIDEAVGYIYNSNSSKSKIITSVLCAGMYPKIARIDYPDAKYSQTASGAIKNKYSPESLMILTKPPEFEKGGKSLERSFIHPRSTNFKEGEWVYPFILYNDKIVTSKPYLHHITNVSPLTCLLFSLGGNIEIDKSYQTISLDKWLKFKATSGKIIVLFKEIRLLFNHLLKQKIDQPSYSTSSSIIIDIITKLILSEGYL